MRRDVAADLEHDLRVPRQRHASAGRRGTGGRRRTRDTRPRNESSRDRAEPPPPDAKQIAERDRPAAATSTTPVGSVVPQRIAAAAPRDADPARHDDDAPVREQLDVHGERAPALRRSAAARPAALRRPRRWPRSGGSAARRRSATGTPAAADAITVRPSCRSSSPRPRHPR